MLLRVTSAVLVPERQLLQTLGSKLAAVGVSTLLAGPAFAAPSEPATPNEVAPANPDAVDGDLGAIDDGPDVAPDTNAPEFEPDEGVEYVDDFEPEPEPEPETEADVEADDDFEPIRPPRVDGPYLGVLAFGTANFASVIDLDTPNPLLGGGGFIQAGDAVFPWMSIGIAAGGQVGAFGNQRLFEGALLVEFGFIPVKRYPLSIRAGFGFGGGAVRQDDIDKRFGFGGALFKGSLRYEFFPLAGKNRPDRGGGWAIGPELGWLGATPAAKGQPFVNTVLLGVSTSFYWGS